MSNDEQMFDGQHAADPLDRAEAEVEALTAEAREQQQRAMRRDMPPPKSDGTCADEDCGDEVEPERLALGLGLCLSCAEQRERARLRRKRGY